MKYLLIILILLPFTYINTSYCQSGTVNVSIRSNDTSAVIYVDSNEAGKGSIANYNISKGLHSIRIIKGGLRSWEQENKSAEVNIQNDTTLIFNFRYFYNIGSLPSDAGVYRNDSLLGLTPLRIYFESPLSGSLLFRKTNYKEKLISGDILKDSSNIFVYLEPSIVGTESEVYKNKQTNFKSERNYWAIGSFGAATLGAAISTINFKNIANKSYDNYLLSGNQSDFNNANQNDIYSTVSLVVMQAALAGFIYFLFIK